MSEVVISPISFFFSITGRRRTFFVLNFLRALVMSAPGFIVVTFFVMISLTGVSSKSFSFDFETAHTKSFSVIIPRSFLFSVMIRLPTLFLIMILAQSFRDVSGGTCVNARVMRSPTFREVSMFV